MTTAQIKKQLMKAYGVTTAKELKKYLKKTDMRKKAELLHAVGVIWNYGSLCTWVVDRSAVKTVLDSLDSATANKVAYEAKFGFGTL
jgi:uncharacterized Rmd1/YagE family protein